jgi:hypothetical protein
LSNTFGSIETLSPSSLSTTESPIDQNFSPLSSCTIRQQRHQLQVTCTAVVLEGTPVAFLAVSQTQRGMSGVISCQSIFLERNTTAMTVGPEHWTITAGVVVLRIHEVTTWGKRAFEVGSAIFSIASFMQRHPLLALQPRELLLSIGRI